MHGFLQPARRNVISGRALLRCPPVSRIVMRGTRGCWASSGGLGLLALVVAVSGSVASAAGTGAATAADPRRSGHGVGAGRSGPGGSGRLAQLDGSISALEQPAGIQAQLNRDRAQLLLCARPERRRDASGAPRGVRGAGRDRALAAAGRDLRIGSPDLVTVVLEAHGFQDLLDQLGFEQRVRKQDVEVVSSVKAARRAVAARGDPTRRARGPPAEPDGQVARAARPPRADAGQPRPASRSPCGATAEEGGSAGECPRPGRRPAQPARPHSRPPRLRCRPRGRARRQSAPSRRRLGAAAKRVRSPPRSSAAASSSRFRRAPRAAERVVAGPGRRHRRAREHARVRGVLGDDRPARHRRLRTVGAGAPLRQPARRLQLRLLRPRRARKTSSRSAPTSARAR